MKAHYRNINREAMFTVIRQLLHKIPKTVFYQVNNDGLVLRVAFGENPFSNTQRGNDYRFPPRCDNHTNFLYQIIRRDRHH